MTTSEKASGYKDVKGCINKSDKENDSEQINRCFDPEYWELIKDLEKELNTPGKKYSHIQEVFYK